MLLPGFWRMRHCISLLSEVTQVEQSISWEPDPKVQAKSIVFGEKRKYGDQRLLFPLPQIFEVTARLCPGPYGAELDPDTPKIGFYTLEMPDLGTKHTS